MKSSIGDESQIVPDFNGLERRPDNVVVYEKIGLRYKAS